MTTTRISFPGALGETLAARIEEPPDGARAWALLAHCFTCSKDLKALGRISSALANEGFGVLRFDFTGLGESDGDFADTNFSSNLDDLEAAAAFAARELGPLQVLVGHSLGGAAVLAVAERLPEVKAVVTIGAPSDPGHVAGLFEGAKDEIEAKGEAVVSLAGRPFRIRRQLLDDLEEHRLAEQVGALRRPLMILHAPTDEVVGIDHARKLFEAARHPKSFVSLADADHLLLKNPRDGELVGHLVSAWASRYVDLQTPEPLARGTVVVETGPKGYTTSVRAGRHHQTADEPEGVGDDLGPTPYDYLLAGLGSCTSMTLRMYADRKQWPLEAVRVELSHRRIHARDCEECDAETGMISRIERRLAVSGPLDDEQRARLLEIADRCPVHRTLTNEVSIRTELVDG